MRSPLRNLISRISDACGSPLARVSLIYRNMNEILTDVLVGAAFVEAAVMACLLFELIYELPPLTAVMELTSAYGDVSASTSSIVLGIAAVSTS